MQVTEDATLAVALVEDDRRFRGVLQMLMEGTPGFDLAFAAGSVEEALRIVPMRPPRVILLDIHLPGMSGIEGVQPIRERFPDAVVLMLTVFEDEDRIFEALCNGAGGYLLKKTPPARLCLPRSRPRWCASSPSCPRKWPSKST